MPEGAATLSLCDIILNATWWTYTLLRDNAHLPWEKALLKCIIHNDMLTWSSEWMSPSPGVGDPLVWTLCVMAVCDVLALRSAWCCCRTWLVKSVFVFSVAGQYKQWKCVPSLHSRAHLWIVYSEIWNNTHFIINQLVISHFADTVN